MKGENQISKEKGLLYFTWALKSVVVRVEAGESLTACGKLLVPIGIPGTLETLIGVWVQLPEDDLQLGLLFGIVGVGRAETAAGLHGIDEDNQGDLNCD